jgi:hypothetical protein
MNLHAFVRRRCIPRGVSLPLVLALACPSLSARPQTPDLPQADITSGISLHNSFYDDLDDAITLDLSGRTGTYPGTDFVPYMEEAEDVVTQFNPLLQGPSFEAALDLLIGLFPEFGPQLTALKEYIQLTGYIACQGDPFQIGAELNLPSARVFGICTLAGDPIQWSQLPDGSGHEILVDASEVGVISQVVITMYLGSPDGLCVWHETEDLSFVFEDLQYRALVTFTSGGPQVDVTLVSALPDVTPNFDGASGSITAGVLWNAANVDINGKDLEETLAEFATDVVTQSLEQAIEQYWCAYVPHNAGGGLANWLMDLSGGKQNARFSENVVIGSVASAVYDPTTSDVPDGATRAVLHNLHTAVFADDDPGCAAGGSFINASAGMSPNFDVESPAVHGAFHTSFKNFEHVVVGGIRAAVGLRAEYKDLSSNDYIVEYPFTRLVPEGDETVTFLLSDVTSDMTDPGNPGSVPISGTQRAALLATPVGGGQTLGDLELGDLSLKIAICEQSKTILPFPLPSTNSGGTVSHDVVLQVTIEKAGVPILTEYYDATFVGDLLLSKVPKQDSTELRTIRATLSSLSTIVSGLDWSAVTSSVPFSSAPVSLFLRAVFGDHGIPATSADQRVFYLVEGMTGPLVERSAHGMVVLPGLDFPAYNGPVIADQLSAHGFYDDDYQLGFKFDRPRLCASVARWGEAPGLLNGVPSGLLRNRTLVVEVDWNESSNLTQTERKMMLTNVTGDVAIAASPYAVSIPSRYDSGHLLTDYEPVIGDESRVSDMS